MAAITIQEILTIIGCVAFIILLVWAINFVVWDNSQLNYEGKILNCKSYSGVDFMSFKCENGSQIHCSSWIKENEIYKCIGG